MTTYIEVSRGNEQAGEIERLVFEPMHEEGTLVVGGEETKAVSGAELVGEIRRMQNSHAQSMRQWNGAPNVGQKPYLYGEDEACEALEIEVDTTPSSK